MKYLRNNAQPQTITIYNQRSIEYLSEAKNGKYAKHRIDIAMQREGRDWKKEDKIDRFAIKHNLASNNKLLIRYKNGEYVQSVKNPELRPVFFSFTVIHYPHVINFIRGEGVEDERKYNFLVGEVVKVENDYDADEAMKTFHFIDQVNEKGEIVKENPYRREYKPMEVDYSKIPKHYEEKETLPGMKKGEPHKPRFEVGGEEDE